MSPTVQQRIEQAMAKAFFADAWTSVQEEKDGDDPTRITLWGEITDMLPKEIDPAALHAARTLMMDMERANARPIAVIYANVIVLEDGGDREPTPENFGHYCAMQAMGHGVGLADAFGHDAYAVITVPYVEFGSCSLEKDY